MDYHEARIIKGENMFDKNKILTAVTADQAHVGQMGWVASSVRVLKWRVENEKPSELRNAWTTKEGLYPFYNLSRGIGHLFYPAPEPTYRPFKDALECISFLWNNHNQVVDMAGEVQLCAVFDNNGVMITRKDGSELWSFKYMLKQGYTIAGKPFGVEL